MEIYKQFTEITMGKAKGIILSVQIRGDQVQYEVAYWNDFTRSVMWLFPEEFIICGTDQEAKMQIGFNAKC